MGLDLARALRLTGGSAPQQPAQVVAFVGAGGKTTAMFQLARQLTPPVIVTTTTHLGAWQASLADRHQILAIEGRAGTLELNGVTLVTGTGAADNRFGSPSNSSLLWLRDIAQSQGIPLLIEADGARQKPLKAPGDREPVIPPFSSIVVIVAGLSGLGKPLSEEFVHRSEYFASASGLKLDEQVTADALARVLKHPEVGGLKHVPPKARRVALLSQADRTELQAQARRMAAQLLAVFDAVIAADLQAPTVHAVYEPVAGIVLAAGGSKRLGRPKQLLDWHGQPFTRAVAGAAVSAGLDPVIVVTGAHANEVASTVDGLPVKIIQNGEWQSGQSSSMKAGLRGLSPSIGSAVFLLADQPQVTPNVIRALVDTHSTGLHAIVAPLVMMEQRANPVLFDRDTFPDLMALEGDVGGRAIFSKYRVEYMPWHDDRLLLDVDTEADYKRLVEDDSL